MLMCFYILTLKAEHQMNDDGLCFLLKNIQIEERTCDDEHEHSLLNMGLLLTFGWAFPGHVLSTEMLSSLRQRYIADVLSFLTHEFQAFSEASKTGELGE